MSDLNSLYTALQNADAAGDTASAQQIADYIRTQGSTTPQYGSGQSFDAVNGQLLPTGSPAAVAAQSPVSGIPTFQQFVAGYGRAAHNLAQGLGQATGAPISELGESADALLQEPSITTSPLVSRQDVANSRALDAPLLATRAGWWGNALGTTLDMAPTAFIPGANTLAGSAAIGAGLGALQPSTSTREMLTNTGMGAALAPASILAGRVVGSLYQGAKGLVSPFFQSGQEGIAARTLQSFAGGPEAARAAADSIANAGETVPGVQPMTAELANNAGLNQLERTVRNNPDYLQAITDRLQSNRQAMTSALSDIAGTDADRLAAEEARSQVSGPLYDAARSASAPIDDQMTALLQRPSMQSAIARAQRLAAENGKGFGLSSYTPGMPMQLTGSDLQYLKMSLNDMANSGYQQGMGSHEINAIRGTLSDLNAWTSANVPELRAADAAFQNASIPINQMDLGQALTQKLQPALSDFGGAGRQNANAYASALRNGDQLAAKVTGWKGATLDSTLSPDQMRTVTQVAMQLARRDNADNVGRAIGSNTAQNLISQNMLRQMLGPLGLPQGWAERAAQSTLLQTGTRPLQWAGQIGQGRVMGNLARAALEPQYAQGLLTQASAPSAWAQFPRFLPPAALAYSSQQ